MIEHILWIHLGGTLAYWAAVSQVERARFGAEYHTPVVIFIGALGWPIYLVQEIAGTIRDHWEATR